MKFLNTLLSLAAVLILCSCAAGPHMRMDLPDDSDSTEYNGHKVYLHSITQGDFGKQSAGSADSSKIGNIMELVVDSLPHLEYRIGPMDMVQIVVWEHPELTSPMGQYQPAGQRVTTEGTLFYPYAGEIKAAGLTAQELRAEITKRLSNKILNDPQVDVRVTGYNSLKAFVSGEVKKPGYIKFDENPMTLPAALADVGGFTDDADMTRLQIRRKGKVYDVDYNSVVASGIPLDRLLLLPDDQIYVASKAETRLDDRVFVLGEVQRTGIVNMREGKLSLIDALATSGGLQAVNASARSVYVIRNTSDSQIDVFHLNAKNAMALAMAEKFELDAHDIVYVDASDLATWNRIVGLIAPTSKLVTDFASSTAGTARNIELIKLNGWHKE